MAKDDLSPRENEIVELSAEGLTNEAIAHKLGLSIGTVNTYWLRIKFKTGGYGRTDVVLKIYKRRFEQALSQEKIDWEALAAILEKRENLDAIAERARDAETHTRLAMLQLVMDFNETSAWATDHDLTIHMISNGELPSKRSGIVWDDNKTIFEVFDTEYKTHPGVAAHLAALAGVPSDLAMSGDFAGMRLKVVPVADEDGEVICCISILMPVSPAS